MCSHATCPQHAPAIRPRNRYCAAELDPPEQNPDNGNASNLPRATGPIAAPSWNWANFANEIPQIDSPTPISFRLFVNKFNGRLCTLFLVSSTPTELSSPELYLPDAFKSEESYSVSIRGSNE